MDTSKVTETHRNYPKRRYSKAIMNDYGDMLDDVRIMLIRAGFIKSEEDYDRLTEVIIGVLKIKYAKQISKNTMLIQFIRNDFQKGRKDFPCYFN